MNNILPIFLETNIENNKVLEIFNFKSFVLKYQNTKKEICSICLSLRITPCKPNKCRHIFCSKCLGIWFNTKKTCPMCRKGFSRIITI